MPDLGRWNRRVMKAAMVAVLLDVFVLAGCDDPTGVEDATQINTPIVGELPTVSLGWYFTCYLTDLGSPFCWGHGTSGQLGNATQVYSGEPARVEFDGAFITLDAGASHVCAVAEGGLAYCWGNNSNGQVGPVSHTSVLAPIQVGSTLRFASISAGAAHTCGLTTYGAVYCWGDNRWWQLGRDTVLTAPDLPARVETDWGFSILRAGEYHTCGLTFEGMVYCWGNNSDGQTGTAADTIGIMDWPYVGVRPVEQPTAITGIPELADVSSGSSHTCGVTRDFEAFCWGDNEYGQLGNDSFYDSWEPVRVYGGFEFLSISAGHGHTCAITVDNKLYCWGDNYYGQMGRGLVDAGSAVPVPVVGGIDFGNVSTSATHTCGTSVGGEVYCWGENRWGNVGPDFEYSSPAPLKVTLPTASESN